MIGSLKYSDAEYYSGLSLKWSDGPIHILGIDIHNNPDVTAKENYMEILEKVKTICSVWAKRSLSLLGKILVVNTLIVPLLCIDSSS